MFSFFSPLLFSPLPKIFVLSKIRQIHEIGVWPVPYWVCFMMDAPATPATRWVSFACGMSYHSFISAIPMLPTIFEVGSMWFAKKIVWWCDSWIHKQSTSHPSASATITKRSKKLGQTIPAKQLVKGQLPDYYIRYGAATERGWQNLTDVCGFLLLHRFAQSKEVGYLKKAK